MQPRSPKPPASETLSTIAASIKSKIRNTLLASPDFPRLYEQALIAEGHNPNQAKNLAETISKNFRSHMPVQPNVRVCTHIKVTGVRCGSPALRGEQFCYFHQRMHRGVRTPPQARLHPIALIEDEESIQSALMEVINALMRNTIDLKRAALILRALHIAVKNASRVKIATHARNMVREIPDYAAPCGDGSQTRPGGPEVSGRSFPAPESELAIPAAIVPPESRPPQIERPISHAAIEKRRDEILAELRAAAAQVTPDGKAHLGTAHVGAGAPASVRRAESRGPGGPVVSGRSALAPDASPAKKKPPHAAKQPPAPKERKIAAHSLP